MVVLQDPDGLVFWPEWEIAAWTPEYENRWQGVHCSGAVAHRPTPPPPGPWVPLGKSLVLPQLLKRTRKGWIDPAEFVHPWQPLENVPGPPDSPPMANLACTQEQVFQVTRFTRSKCHWITDVGEFTTEGMSEEELFCLHPDLFLISFRRYLNKRRLRRTTVTKKICTYHFHDGREISEPCKFNRGPQFGLTRFTFLEPYRAGLYDSAGLRDWPVELATASEEYLQRHFTIPRRLIANVIWQAWRYRMSGLITEYGSGHRDFWYMPLVIVLGRAGMLEPRGKSYRRDDDAVWGNREKLYEQYEKILASFVIDYHFFTLKQFGFEDPQPGKRFIGKELPQVLVVAEKESSEAFIQRLHHEFGVSAVVLNGQPSLLAMEYLADALRGSGPIHILGLVDFDPHGWIIAQSVANHLVHFGLEVAGTPQPIVLPELFTSEELEILTIPCDNKTKRQKGLNEDWIAKGGGINGQPVGIHGGHLKPYSRVRTRVASLLSTLKT